MSKKAKGIIKFFVACGIVVSAVAAVFTILYRMRAKLKDADETVDDADEGCCDGSCESCDMCGEDAAEESEEVAEEETEQAPVVNE